MSKAIKITTLCMIAILLHSMLSYTIARQVPTYKDVTPEKTHVFKDAKVNGEEDCTGLGEEECLMRRTHSAHLDYIYTNKKKPFNL
ncbi:hypothetical protein M8C21_024039 [Ambrosia artemisiifolia]|uniref:Phytosulfokine n=1 Tax=Ambrosia artemisiifolia TaxID=4212 RepID=A0AAD5CIR4_AMBAR|nr:hypothetical protein M8C21_025644 [Ambrosia artemisiifolia]KAI7741614.1 hypothetical protein M8C21_024039 [Ambrosia artemisiifolia]